VKTATAEEFQRLEEAQGTPKIAYRPEIDGLRALAVIPVILFHAGFKTFSGGFVGVDVFFVISGYLITSIILKDLEAGRFSLIEFYERRARRILPALFFVLFACLPFAWNLMLPADLKNFSKSLIGVSTFTSNFLFWRWSGYFDAASELKPLLHTWSLAVEEQFYLFMPLLLLVTWQSGKRWIGILLTVTALVSVALAHHFSIERPFFSFFLLPTRGWELLVGAILAYYQQEKGDSDLPETARSTLAFLGLLGVLAAVFLFDRSTPSPSFYTLIPTVGAALIIFAANRENYVGRLLSNKLMVHVGLISYSAYLWHQPLFAFSKHLLDGPSKLILGCAVMLTLLLAQFTWAVVEKPFRHRGTFGGAAIVIVFSGLTVAFVSVGIAGVVSSGFSIRFPDSDRPLAELDRFEQGRYCDREFIGKQGKAFEEDGRRKVLLIGDSYAKDVANVVAESALDDKIQISTHYISGGCGNLAQTFDRAKFIRAEDLSGCIRNGWYEIPSIQRQLIEADEIWLASNWQYWVAENLNDSIANLKLNFKKKIVVFGGKDFGRVVPKELLAVPATRRLALRSKIPDEKIRINLFMQENVQSDLFVDLIGRLCDGRGECPLFDEHGELISFDGTHLTAAGARYIGKNISPELLR